MYGNKEFWQIVADAPDPVWPEQDARTLEDERLAILRSLTEVQHFLDHMDENGNVPEETFEAVAQNRGTGASEIAMPYAITETDHEVAYRTDESGKRKRIILWLGNLATGQTLEEVADSGYVYHFSPAAYKRVDIEKAEARYDQETLRPGMAKVFVSPRMSRKDASAAVAKAEHLYSDDAIRTMTAVTDEAGRTVGCRIQSVLVRDIPLSSWVSMLKDPGNIFGKALPIHDEESATSVMELFSQMDLPEDQLPEGPVTLVRAVLPYIQDAGVKQRVLAQIERFGGDQEFYRNEARQAGREWAQFDLELARGIKFGYAQDTQRFFIAQNQHAWKSDSLRVIRQHYRGDTQYVMTPELAALLSRGYQKLLGDKLSVVTNNDGAIREVSAEAMQAIRDSHEALQAARASGTAESYIRALERQQYGLLHSQQIRSGGGCPGEVANMFGKDNPPDGVGELDSPFEASTENRSNWKWKQGICQVKKCPSPKPTEVGPCSVCRHCQTEFDKGNDPTRKMFVRQSQQAGTTAVSAFLGGKPTLGRPRTKDKYVTAA